MTVAQVRQMSGDEWMRWSVYLARKEQQRQIAQRKG